MNNLIKWLTAKNTDLALLAKSLRLQARKVPFYKAACVAASALIIGMLILAGRESTPDFAEFEAGDERKQVFFAYFLPLIENHNKKLMALREELQELNKKRTQLSFFERRRVVKLANTYEVEGFSLGNPAHWSTLLRRVDIVPPSLALAQAANESAWGTSRFAREGNNFFGQWCYVQDCGIVPDSREDGAAHEVTGFESAKESVEQYMHNLNYHPAYFQLRSIRENLRNDQQPITGLKIAAGLQSYSERGEAYIEELRSMIQLDDLQAYDAVINSAL